MTDTVDKALCLVIRKLSDENYAESLASCRVWFDIGQTYYQLPPDNMFDVIWNNRTTKGSTNPGQLIHSTPPLILRFARDVESGHVVAPHRSGLQIRLSRFLREFFSNNVETVWSEVDSEPAVDFHAHVNLIARWANLGYIEEEVIHDHILQSLISLPELRVHQADALIILFMLAGATFGAYADPSTVDRCFQLLNDHHRNTNYYDHQPAKWELMQVRAPRPLKGAHSAKAGF